MKRGWFFDLDNTLIDRDAATASMLEDLLPQPQAFRQALALDRHGRGSRAPLCEFLAAQRPGEFEDAQSAWRCLRDGIAQRAQAKAHAHTLLDTLRGQVPLVLITNGGSWTQRRKLTAAGLVGYFDYIFISEEVGAPKPQALIFQKALEAVGGPSANLKSSDVIMVGDDLENDIAGAHALGMQTCWLRTPYHPVPNLDQAPTYIVQDLSELIALATEQPPKMAIKSSYSKLSVGPSA